MAARARCRPGPVVPGIVQVIVPAIALALAACTEQAAVEGPIRLGQTAYVGGPRVVPERVVEDSRCPADVSCVWAGRVVLRVRVVGGDWSKRLDLVLGVPVDVADGKLTLVAVTPGRIAGRSIRESAGASRFTFVFQGGL